MWQASEVVSLVWVWELADICLNLVLFLNDLVAHKLVFGHPYVQHSIRYQQAAGNNWPSAIIW